MTNTRKKNSAEVTQKIISTLELFRNDEGKPFARQLKQPYHRCISAKSEAMKNYIVSRWQKEMGTYPDRHQVDKLLDAIYAEACYAGKTEKVHLRYAQEDGSVFIDLAHTKANHVVAITKQGWKVLESAPVRFIRHKHTLPLPIPEANGDARLLLKYCNIRDEQAQKLFLAYVVTIMIPEKPYPLLILQGEQGCGKTSATEFLAQVVDPCKSMIRSLPKTERDMIISLSLRHLSCFDNLSGLTPTQSDVLCRVSTGGAYTTRKLHSDDEEQSFELCRPVIGNGIDSIASRADLADRSIIQNLPLLPDEERQEFAAMRNAYEMDRPRILGGLCDAISYVLANYDSVKLEKLPRMARYAKIGTCLEGFFDWPEGSFMKAFDEQIEAKSHNAIEGNPVIKAIIKVCKNGEFQGSASELLKRMNELEHDPSTLRSRYWPKSASSLSKILGREAPNMRRSGFDYENRHTQKGSLITISLGTYAPMCEDSDDNDGVLESPF